MPNIKLPDGNSLKFDTKITGFQIAEKISKISVQTGFNN